MNMPTDAEVAQHDETSRLLSHSEAISSYDGTNSNAASEPLAEPVTSHEVKTALSHLAYVIPMAIGVFLVAMDLTIVVSSYASIGSELNQLQNTSWIATAYMLTQTSFQPLSGKLSDIFGRKTCLLTCYAIFTLGCLLSGLSTSMTQLVLSRAVAGIGGGGIPPLITFIMSDVVPLRDRGTWQGVLGVIFASGSAIGAPLGGFLADNIGWRWAFLIQVPICVLAIASVALALHLPATNKSTSLSANIKRIDIGGAITLVLTVFFLLYGLDRGGNVSWSDYFTIGSLIAFGTSAILFMVFEVSIATEPFAPKRIIFNPSLLACYLSNFFASAALLAQVFHISLFYQAVQGKTASEASVWLVISVIGAMTGSLLGGLTIQYSGKYYAITIVGFFLAVVGTSIVLFSSGVIAISTLGLAVGLALTNIAACKRNTLITSIEVY
ncbi:hypothetical protein AX14_001833 [Amanita brunnescens Koide BX004]|nr:hypothetical protein AX14_001833 [Amanita brunnescens Koide BX004]